MLAKLNRLVEQAIAIEEYLDINLDAIAILFDL